MARSTGPFGPPGASPRRRPGDDPFGTPTQSAGQWPPHPQGYQDHTPAPQGHQQGYHFPPAELPQPGYGYSNPQLLGGPQQWAQQGEPQAYEINYQAYSGAEPGPFQQHQGYADADAEYGEEYYEDDEPRRGPRWILIAVALVGAIGVGGALAYTYRSLVAPSSRVPVVRADSNPSIKVRPEERGGREFPGTEQRAPVRVASEAAPSAPREPANLGPRVVKPIPIGPGSGPAPAASAGIPGITLYQPPEAPAPAAAAPAPEQAASPPAAEPEAAPSPPRERVAIGTPPPAAEPDNDPPAVSQPPVVEPPVREPDRSAAIAPPPPPAQPRARPESSGLGYVAVLSSKKTYMKAVETFADLQQKYDGVLGGKTFDVQEADLSARGLGTMYRVVVGPPGSRSSARGVCNDLKVAGYVGCWVKQY